MVVPAPDSAAPEGLKRLPRRFRSNLISSYLRTGVTAVVALATTPLLVNGLGTEAFGVWALVGSLALYREVLELGFGKATPKYVAEYSALDDPERVRGSVATSFWLLAVPGALALLLGLALAPLFPHLFDVSDDLSTAAQVVVLIIAVDLAVSIPTDAFGGVLIGLQRFDLLNWTLIGTLVAQAIAWTIVIVAGGGLVAIAIVTVSIRLASQLWRYVIARRLLPDMRLSPRYFDRGLVRPFAGLSLWYAIADVATLIVSRIDTIVVGVVLGVEAAAIYAVGLKLPMAVSQLVTPVSRLFFPYSSELAASGDLEGLRRSLLAGTRIMIAIGAPLALTTAILAGPILDTWVGSGFDEAIWVVVFLCGGALISALNQTGLLMLQGIGRARGPAVVLAGEAALNLGLSILFAHLMGVEGVALGTLVASFVTGLLAFLPYLFRQFELPLWPFVRSLLVAHGPPAALAGVVGWLVLREDPSGAAALAGALAAVLGAYVAVFAFTGLSRDERRDLLDRVRRLRWRPSPSSA